MASGGVSASYDGRVRRDPWPGSWSVSAPLLCLLGILPVTATGAPEDADPCRALLPPGLQQVLIKKYPKNRLPLSTENLREDLDYAVSRGGSPCMRVAAGTFFEDGGRGLAILLSPLASGSETRLVVAAQDKKQAWKIIEIWRWSIPTVRVFVETLKPGHFTRSLSVDEPLEKGEVASFFSRREGILSGMTESFGYAFFRAKTRWVHVRVSE